MILATASLKGGVGKTTIAIYLAQALRDRGHRVLTIDLDHNGSLTDYYLRSASEVELEAKNIRPALLGQARLEAMVWQTPMGDVIPATISLSSVGYALMSDPGSVLRFRTALRRLEYDYIILDAHNALTYEMTAALYAADLVLVPVTAMRWTVRGYRDVEVEVGKIEESIGKAPRLLAVPSMVTESEADAIRGVTAWVSTQTAIRRDAAIRAAASEGRALREGTHGQAWFAALAEEVVG